MTEKRYIINNNGEIENTSNHMTWDSFTEVLTILNGQSRHLEELAEENEQLKKFKKQAYSIINNKINKLAMTTSYGDVHNDLRVFAQRVLIDMKKEFDNPTYENCKVNVE